MFFSTRSRDKQRFLALSVGAFLLFKHFIVATSFASTSPCVTGCFWVSTGQEICRVDPCGFVLQSISLAHLGIDPEGVAVEADGTLWVASSVPAEVFHLDLNGAVLDSFQLASPGTQPRDIALDGASVWVCTSGREIQEYSFSGSLLESFVPIVGGNPVGIIVDAATGNLWILDNLGNLNRFSPSGEYLGQQFLAGACLLPVGLDRDQTSGTLWIADGGTNSICVVDTLGNSVSMVTPACFGLTGVGRGAGMCPTVEKPIEWRALDDNDGRAATDAALVDQWVAEWTFDDGAPCDSSGWTAIDYSQASVGLWARTHPHITDNDVCEDNTTCAWLFTDNTTPTSANDPSMFFAPDGYVIQNWLDNAIVSPWTSLPTLPSPTRTFLDFEVFPGNNFSWSRIVLNWAVREKTGGNVSPWSSESEWYTLSEFSWLPATFDMTPYIPSTGNSGSDIQVRFRVSDMQLVNGSTAPVLFRPGPGPYIDRVRIGRKGASPNLIHEGIDSRGQAQDAFPTLGSGLNIQPSTDRFGTAAFSSVNPIMGDRTIVSFVDLSGVGVQSVELWGAIVAGPHANKSPQGGGALFQVPAEPCGTTQWCVGLDDDYFRGGDVLHYFWLVTDNQDQVVSNPPGLSGVPASIAEAENETGGVFEVSFLPAIDWDPAYLARIAAHPTGKLEPTSEELANSTQRNCILYYQAVNSRRRSGDINRTSFMYSLDRLGYRGSYDVYDHQGFGSTNNQLAGRATVAQAIGYDLLVYDVGNRRPDGNMMPDGSDPTFRKVDQATWFRNWLAQASSSEGGVATLWLIGSNLIEDDPSASLYLNDMEVVLSNGYHALSPNPDVVGEASFTFATGAGSAVVDYTTGARALFSISGGCPRVSDHDGLGAAGSAVEVFRYFDQQSGGDAAVVMNSNPAGNWNTIVQSFPWSDMHAPSTADSLLPQNDMLLQTLGAVLPPGCQQSIDPTNVWDDGDELDSPRRTALHQNVPNPFNPRTTIRFDLAQDGPVKLRVFDVSGRLVRTLIDKPLARDGHRIVWDGFDNKGASVSSGIYFYRLETADLNQIRKMVVLR